jgi:hypothetical protein
LGTRLLRLHTREQPLALHVDALPDLVFDRFARTQRN